MRCSTVDCCPMAVGLRWAGRALGLAGFTFVAWFLVAHVLAGEGPNPFRMTATELALTVTFFAAVAGMLVGWRWEVVGGVMIVAGMLLFFVIERTAGGSWPRGWVLWAFLLPGVLYLFAACLDARCPSHPKVTT
jgi:hypothetical protein